MSSASVPGQLVQSLYLTLIHSLWQGLLLAAAVGLIMITTRSASARKRYNLLIMALFLFVAGCITTFIKAWLDLRATSVLSITPGDIITGQPQTLAAFHPGKGSFVSGLIAYLNAHAGNIVLFWFLAICIRSLQLALGLQGLRKLRRTAIVNEDAHWQQYVKDLSAKMGIRRFVSLAESGMAKVPLVIGHFKPLILIPVGLITALPPGELEAILIHELAHIRRRDYLVNLLQSLLEILFFFNPAIWWISSLIRAEREHCCDDIALAQTSSKKNYIQALVACEEYQLPVQAYAMALKGSKKHLVTRVKRIISNNNASLNLMEKSMLAICLVAAGLLMAAFTNKKQAGNTDTTKTEIQAPAATNTTGNEDQVALAEPAVPFDAVTTEIALPEPAVKPEPAEQAEPVAVAAETHDAVQEESQQENQDRKEAEARKRSAEADRRRSEALAIANTQREEALADIARRRDEAIAEARSKYEEGRGRLEEARHRQSEAIAQARYKQDEARRKMEDAQRKQDENIRRQQEAARHIHEEALRKHDEALRKHDEALRKQGQAVRQQESTTGVILSELVKDGIVGKNDKSLDFKLTNDEFVVNKVRQPEPVFRKYKERYLKATGKSGGNWSVKYKRSND